MTEIDPRGNSLMELKEKYVTDERGNRIAVLLDIEEYQKILEKLEELDAIKAYDNAILSEDEELPFEVAIAEIENSHS
ncbi:hypothetical protein V0288_21170 [Pannus brasiliensis CCIBt3594]|uniref:Uncharacterized protein n=2 Tax=Pannus TaxID=1427526 RepID=A0AAW9QPE8_9CHRO